MTEFDMTLYYNWGRSFRLGANFFWNTHLRNGTQSEFEDGMTIRSNCFVDKFKLIVHENDTVNNTFFALRKNGNNSIGSTADDVLTFDVFAGAKLTLISDAPIFFAKNDLICWKYREFDTPNNSIEYEIQCRLRYLKPPPFP